MFMLHERKLRITHDEIMRVVANEILCLVSGKQMVPLVTDDEKGFGAIDEYLPKVHRFLCWNHLINAAKVFPQEYCSCPSTTTCYHILAVKLGLRIPVSKDPRKVNLTQLRWNTRAKNQKRSGRKRPRPGILMFIMINLFNKLFFL